jgi:hypothetical protein
VLFLDKRAVGWRSQRCNWTDAAWANI